MLEESGDESEEEAIVNKVLDEIGIEISGKVVYILLIDHMINIMQCVYYRWCLTTHNAAEVN